MRGAPWDGMFYGFVLAVIVLIGALVMALGSDDALTRTVSWALVVLCSVAMARIVRRVMGLPEADRPTGRWWFGG